MKKNNKKGFTLMEMLIVVAIIAVLVAIAIPVFSTSLEKAREATDAANIRSAYAEASVKALTEGAEQTVTVKLTQQSDGWEHIDAEKIGSIKLSDLSGVGKNKTVTLVVSADGTVKTPIAIA